VAYAANVYIELPTLSIHTLHICMHIHMPYVAFAYTYIVYMCLHIYAYLLMQLSPPLAPQGHILFEEQSALVLSFLAHEPPKNLLETFTVHEMRDFMKQLIVALQQVHQVPPPPLSFFMTPPPHTLQDTSTQYKHTQ